MNDRNRKESFIYLTACPKCGSDLDSFHREYVSDDETEIYLRCLDCAAEYRENWVLTKITEKSLETA